VLESGNFHGQRQVIDRFGLLADCQRLPTVHAALDPIPFETQEPTAHSLRREARWSREEWLRARPENGTYPSV